MLKIAVYDMFGSVVGETGLSEEIFGIEPNQFAIHEVVVSHLANKRQGTKSALTRAEVSGGGRKPWRQKGTGNARQGSIRSPQWRHGGIVFAPKPRDFKHSVNKKVRRIAMKSVFSGKFSESQVTILDNISLNEYKTRTMCNVFKNLDVNKKALLVLPSIDNKVIKSSSNIPGIKTAQVNELNVYDILNHNKLIILQDAIKKIEEVYA